MIKTLRHLKRGIVDDGCTTSKDFKSFARVFKNELAKELKEFNVTNHEQNTGHYYVSGFFKKENQWWYYSINDVRYFNYISLLIRTAKDNRDFTGGANHYLEIKPGMFKDFFVK